MKNETKWSIDQSHSEIAFKVRHLMIAHIRGKFNVYDASIYTTGNDFSTAEIDIWIDPNSVATGDGKRDEHLKTADFFDIQNHKQITFSSGTMGKTGDEVNMEVWGDLTIKGITKHIKLDVQFGGFMEDAQGNKKAGFSISGKINRNDWNLVWNSPLGDDGLLLGNEIEISCEIELTKASNKDAAMVLEHVTEEKHHL